MGCWLFRGKTLIFKESVERPALFYFKGIEFETVRYEYGGNPLQNVTDSKLIKNRLCVYNPSKSTGFSVFRGFRDDFLIETERDGLEKVRRLG